MPLLYTVWIKIECLPPWLSHVRKVGSHVTLRLLETYYMGYIARLTLFCSPALSTLDLTKYENSNWVRSSSLFLYVKILEQS